MGNLCLYSSPPLVESGSFEGHSTISHSNIVVWIVSKERFHDDPFLLPLFRSTHILHKNTLIVHFTREKRDNFEPIGIYGDMTPEKGIEIFETLDNEEKWIKWLDGGWIRKYHGK
eukprot:gnl/Carplike_NY0171/10473_a14762_187.p1 GENE.gnl/Carplike_NY0171/10473_a14762_187~~gnl/Carplike_NY0171/10473_a14762_187.p1  ORF type:complete len:115 (-),score=9.46 gnl/Carplike_NY0171/10473_a14762_187:28-372(-)